MTDAERLSRHALAVAEGRQRYDSRDFAVPRYESSLHLRSYRGVGIYWRKRQHETLYIVDEKEFDSVLFAERYIDEKVEKELSNPPMHLIAKYLPPR